MQLPIVCPCCKNPLLNNFREYPVNKPQQLEKTCRIKPDHIFVCVSRKGCEDEIGVIKITVNLNTMLSFHWMIENKQLWFTTGFNKVITELPYIEPDLDNYEKLVKRLKKLVVFV
jgi:hypothetical protein